MQIQVTLESIQELKDFVGLFEKAPAKSLNIPIPPAGTSTRETWNQTGRTEVITTQKKPINTAAIESVLGKFEEYHTKVPNTRKAVVDLIRQNKPVITTEIADLHMKETEGLKGTSYSAVFNMLKNLFRSIPTYKACKGGYKPIEKEFVAHETLPPKVFNNTVGKLYGTSPIVTNSKFKFDQAQSRFDQVLDSKWGRA